MNPMREIRIEKLTLNMGAGKDQARLEKGVKLLNIVAGIPPVKTVTNKRIPSWGLRPGLPVGCKITLRKEAAGKMLLRLLKAVDNKLALSQFDDYGNLAFGIEEYMDIPDVKYDPELGIMGLEVCVTFERPGFRIKRRKIMKKRLSRRHVIKKEEAMDFMKSKFGVKVGESE